MRCRRCAVLGLAVLAATLSLAPAASGQSGSSSRCTRWRAAPTRSPRPPPASSSPACARRRAGIRADAVLTRAQRAKLAAAGVKVRLKRNKRARPSREQARAQAAGGFNVCRSWDEPGGIRDELYAIARDEPAARQARGARPHPSGPRADRAEGHPGRARGARRLAPVGPLLVDQHAREWISLEVNRRLLHHFIDRWRANDKEIRRSAQGHRAVVRHRRRTPTATSTRSTHERLWRKNLRDNNGDGQITVGDGVDPNRNFAEHWGYDNEGSSPDPADETYRGPSAALGARDAGDAGPDQPDQAELPVQPALVRRSGCCTRRAGRSARSTRTTRSTSALGGTDADPAIPGFNPGQSADTLYVTNGETTDYADTSAGTVAYTPELGEGDAGSRASCSRTTRR